MEPNKEQIKEINQHISDALEQCQNTMLEADCEKWGFFLKYSDRDLLNALYIFTHVAQSRAFKGGFFENANDAIEKTRAFCKAIEDCLGFNTTELANKVLKNGDQD